MVTLRKQTTKPVVQSRASVQKAYQQRLTAAGFARATCLIPKVKRAEFNAATQRLKKKWEKEAATA